VVPAPELPDDPEPLFEDHARRYVDYSRRQHSASTHRTRRSLVEAKLVPFFEGRRLSDIGVQDVEALLARSGDLSPATRNRILSALSALLAYAVRLGYLGRNVAASIPRAPEDVMALPLVPLEKQQVLLEAIPPEKRLLFLAALDTGARLGELLELRWSDIDWEVGALRVRRSKSRRPRIVRASRRLTRALRASAGAHDDPGSCIFADAIGADGGLRWAWRASLRRAARAIGHRLRFHDFRHLAAINLVRAGLDLPTIQAHLGHRHLVSTLRYAAYADETASARAARTLDRLHGEEAASPDPPRGENGHASSPTCGAVRPG
jgi:integrase